MNKTMTAAIGASLISIASANDTKPNIVVFLVDDMGVMDTSQPFLVDKTGKPKAFPLNEFYRTPAMERLAKNGVSFSRFYANSVCSPTRASIMTGQSSARHKTTQFIHPNSRNSGPKEWNWEGLKKETVTLPRLLQKAGYETIHCGKAHFAPVGKEGENPNNLGFDVNIAGCAYGLPGSYYGEKSYGKGGRRAVPGLDKYHGTKTFLTEALTIEALKAIDVAKKKDKPFFLYMSHYAVHGPFNSDPRFAPNYKESGKKSSAQAFATLIEGMDKSLNDVLNHLERIGEAENTFVIFLGDNGSDSPLGGATNVGSSAPLRGKKGSCYEGGMRVPFIAAWAKSNPESAWQKSYPVKKGIISDAIGSVEDVFPTVLALAGTAAPKNHVVDGSSLIDGFATHKGKKDQTFLMHFPHNHRSNFFTSYVDGTWKLIYFYPVAKKKKAGTRKVELYDLASDPYEQKDLSKTNPEKAQEMLKGMIAELDDADAQYITDKDGKELRPER